MGCCCGRPEIEEQPTGHEAVKEQEKTLENEVEIIEEQPIGHEPVKQQEKTLENEVEIIKTDINNCEDTPVPVQNAEVLVKGRPETSEKVVVDEPVRLQKATLKTEVEIIRTDSNKRNLPVHIQNTKVSNKDIELCSTKLVTKSDISFILDYIHPYAKDLNWDDKDYSKKTVYFVQLKKYSREYSDVEKMFRSTNKNYFNIQNIERIQNPFLLAAFLLKREEMEDRIGDQDIEALFHGTKQENVRRICTNNFDWRLCGRNNAGSRFGMGVYFTPISNYATHYANKKGDNRVMLVVDVLVGLECVGRPNMTLPDDGTDTSIKWNRQVFVKYEDNEFYPTHKIIYNCTQPREFQNGKSYNQRHRVR